MSFQGYLDTIKAKTGKGPDEFRALAQAKGLVGPDVKAGAVIAWLKQDFDLGHGHAMAIVSVLKGGDGPPAADGERIDKLFAGGKAAWRSIYDGLLERARGFGADVGVSPASSYVSLVRGAKKFAILQPAAGHLDIGVKRKGAPPTDRFAPAGAWNSMVTHRVRISDPAEIDAELLDWLRLGYADAA